MKTLYIASVMLLASLMACSAMTCTSAGVASAETTLEAEWLANGKAVVENDPFTIPFLFSITDQKLGATVICRGSLDGTVGILGIDNTTEVLNSKKEKVAALGGLALLGTGNKNPDCEAGKNCAEGTAASPIEVWPKNLPWSTQLFTMGDGTLLDILKSEAWDIKCLVLGIASEDTCEVSATDIMIDNNLEGDAEIPESSRMEPFGDCSVGGEESEVVEMILGSQITLTDGELLSVNAL